MKKRVNFNVLELTSRKQFIPAKGFETNIELIKIKKSVNFDYSLPLSNTLKPDWWEHLSWNNEILHNFFAFPEIHFFIALHEGEVIGSFDLIVLPDRQVEIKNFGLSNNYLDFELRAMFLSKAVDYCFQYDPKRIFFQASEFEKMSAISNYLSQGFIISSLDKEISENNSIVEKTSMVADFLINLN